MNYRIAIIAAGMVLLAGCGHKAEGQTVAVVDGQEVTLSELNFDLGIANVPPGVDKNAARAQVLQGIIDRRLLANKAKAEGVETTPDFVNRKQRGEEDLLIALLSQRRLNTVALPSVRETDAFMASHPGMFAKRELWDLAQVQYQPPADRAIQAEIDKTHSFTELLAILQKHGVTIAQQKNRLDTAIVPAELFQKIAGLPAGEPFVVRIGDRAIASVIVSRETKPLVGDQARPLAADALRKEQSAQGMAKLVADLRKGAKIEYQKGFAPPKK